MKLSQALREATAALHRRAERTGVVAELLRGSAACEGYVLLLRNLLPAYRALEAALQGHAELAFLAPRELLRGAALERDLRALRGADFEQEVSLLDAGVRYAERIARVGRARPVLLTAHAYTRYLGDLSGGAILARRLARDLALGDDCLGFYRFPDIDRPDEFKRGYRGALDAMEIEAGDCLAIADEACAAFRHNIDVSAAVSAVTAGADQQRARAQPST